MAVTCKFIELETFGFGPYAMKKSRVCSGCGHITNTEEKECPICGTTLAGQTLYDQYKQMHSSCPVCDTVLTEGAKYCPHCGAKR